MAHNPSQNVRKQGQAERPYKDRSNGLVRKAIDQRLPPMASGGPLPANQAQSAGGPQLGSQTSLSNAPRPLGGYGSPTHAGTPQGLGGATRLPPLRNPGVGQRERGMVSNAGVNSQLGAMGGGMSNQPRPDIKQGVPGSRGAGVAGMVRNSTDQNTRSAYQTANPQFDRNGLVYGATNIGGGVHMDRLGSGNPQSAGDFRTAANQGGAFGQGLAGGPGIMDHQRGELQRGKQGSEVMYRPDQHVNQMAEQQQAQGQTAVDNLQALMGVVQGTPQTSTSSSALRPEGGPPPKDQSPPPQDQGGQQQQQQSGGGEPSPQDSGRGGVEGYGSRGGRTEGDPQTFTNEGADVTLDDNWEGLASDLGTEAGFVKYLAGEGFEFYRDREGNVQWYHPSEQGWGSHQDAGDFTDEFEGGDEVGKHWQNYQQEGRVDEAEQQRKAAEQERVAANQRIWDELGKAEQMDMSSLAGSYDRMKTAMEAQYKKQRAESQEAMSARASRGNLPSGAAMAAQTMGSNQFDIANAQQRGALDIDHETKVVQAKMRDADRRYQTAMMMAAQASTREERAQAEAYAREARQEMQSWENYVHERDKPGALEMILGIGGAVAGPVAGALTGGIGSAIGGAGGAAAGAARGQSPNEAELARLARQKKQQGFNQGNTGPAY